MSSERPIWELPVGTWFRDPAIPDSAYVLKEKVVTDFGERFVLALQIRGPLLPQSMDDELSIQQGDPPAVYREFCGETQQVVVLFDGTDWEKYCPWHQEGF